MIGPALIWWGATNGPTTAPTTDGSINLILAVLATGVGAALVSGWWRRRSGEDEATAADNVAGGAAQMAGAVADIIKASREENARLLGRITELQTKVAEKSEENALITLQLAEVQAQHIKIQHETQVASTSGASELAALAAERDILKRRLRELTDHRDALLVQLGEKDDRRVEERRDNPPQE